MKIGALLLALALVSDQGAPVYQTGDTDPFPGMGCDGDRVQVSHADGKIYICQSGIWVQRLDPEAPFLLQRPSFAYPNAHVLSDWETGLLFSQKGMGARIRVLDTNQAFIGTGSGAISAKTIPSCSNASTSKLLYNNSTQTFSCGSDQTGGGGSSIYVDAEIPSGLINGSNVTYTLAAAPSPDTSLHLYANGVRLRPTTDYSLATATVTMVAALQTGDWFYADYRSASSGNYADNEIPSGTINGSNTAFTLASTPTTGALHVYLNGVRLRPTTDYTISGTSLTMVMVPQTGDWLYADYRY